MIELLEKNPERQGGEELNCSFIIVNPEKFPEGDRRRESKKILEKKKESEGLRWWERRVKRLARGREGFDSQFGAGILI